jgi:hypothetical protein
MAFLGAKQKFILIVIVFLMSQCFCEIHKTTVRGYTQQMTYLTPNSYGNQYVYLFRVSRATSVEMGRCCDAWLKFSNYRIELEQFQQSAHSNSKIRKQFFPRKWIADFQTVNQTGISCDYYLSRLNVLIPTNASFHMCNDSFPYHSIVFTPAYVMPTLFMYRSFKTRNRADQSMYPYVLSLVQSDECGGNHACKKMGIASEGFPNSQDDPGIQTLGSANVSGNGLQRITATTMCICTASALQNIIPSPQYGRGDAFNLKSEMRDSDAIVVDSNFKHIIAASKSNRLTVLNSSRRIRKGSSNVKWPFKPGDYVLLNFFSLGANNGVFLVSSVDGDYLKLGNVPLSDAHYGETKFNSMEKNEAGATIIGCTGALVGPSRPQSSITMLGFMKNINRSLIRISPNMDYKMFYPGEIVRLQHFKRNQNNGVYRVSGWHGENVLQIVNVASCQKNFKTCKTNLHEGRNNLLSNPYEYNYEISAKKLFYIQKRLKARSNFFACNFHCSGHGTCLIAEKTCRCDSSWSGRACQFSTLPCPKNCNFPRGVCVNETGKCKCGTFFTGIDCSISRLPCPNDCSGHGTCHGNTGQCVCFSTWDGISCSQPKIPCPHACSRHGFCDYSSGRCVCESSWTGLDCSEMINPCPNKCSGHGKCDYDNGKCKCNSSWIGLDCATKKCPLKCNNDHGRCVDGVCVCDHSWEGDACEIPSMKCPKACSGHGLCVHETGTCLCMESWTSIDCSARNNTCHDDCHGHGKCDSTTGECNCEFNYAGKTCERKVSPCPNNCSGLSRGVCNMDKGVCACHRAWTDIDCSQPMCGNHGTMLPDGSCEGDYGWYAPVKGGKCKTVGSLCKPTIKCIADGSESDTCNLHAVGCSNVGACMCSKGWTGAVCHKSVEVTGEQNFRNDREIYHYFDGHKIEDPTLQLYKSIFLTYTWANWESGRTTLCREEMEIILKGSQSMFSDDSNIDFILDHMFEDNKNYSKCMSFSDFICMIWGEGDVNRYIIPGAINYAFVQYDQDQDGVISFSDIIQYLLKMEVFAKVDAKYIRLPLTHTNCFASIDTGSRKLYPTSNICQQLMIGDVIYISGQKNTIQSKIGNKYSYHYLLQNFHIGQTVTNASVSRHKTIGLGTQKEILCTKGLRIISVVNNGQQEKNLFNRIGGDIIMIGGKMYATIATQGGGIQLNKKWTSDTVKRHGLYILTKDDLFMILGIPQEYKLMHDWRSTMQPPQSLVFRQIWKKALHLWNALPNKAIDRVQFQSASRLSPIILGMISPHWAFIVAPDQFSKRWCSKYASIVTNQSSGIKCCTDICDFRSTMVQYASAHIHWKNCFSNSRRIQAIHRFQENLQTSSSGGIMPASEHPAIKLFLIPDCWREGADVYADGDCKESVPPWFDIHWYTANSFEDCEYADPYEDPHCPTDNNELNVLMKFIVPGMKRPAIDQTEAKIMQGQSFPMQLFKMVINVLDGGGSRGGTESEEVDHESKLVPFLKKGLYSSVVNDMSESLSGMLTQRIKEPLQEELFSSLEDNLRDFLNITISHGLEHILGNTVTLLLSHSIPALISRVLPTFVFHKLALSLTGILGRALLHSVIPSVVACIDVNSQAGVTEDYAHFYAAYYGDYYSAFYLKQLFQK